MSALFIAAITAMAAGAIPMSKDIDRSAFTFPESEDRSDSMNGGRRHTVMQDKRRSIKRRHVKAHKLAMRGRK
jgi:hypothetical protein